MAPLSRIHLEGECYHVSSVLYRRARLLAGPENARLAVDALQFQRSKRAHLFAYVVMPDHFHAVIVPRSPWNISQVMQSVKGYAARLINARRSTRGPLWQRSFYDRMIRDESQLFETIEYIHLNPVVAGLVEEAETYEFSSAARPEKVDLDEFYRD